MFWAAKTQKTRFSVSPCSPTPRKCLLCWLQLDCGKQSLSKGQGVVFRLHTHNHSIPETYGSVLSLEYITDYLDYGCNYNEDDQLNKNLSSETSCFATTLFEGPLESRTSLNICPAVISQLLTGNLIVYITVVINVLSS